MKRKEDKKKIHIATPDEVSQFAEEVSDEGQSPEPTDPAENPSSNGETESAANESAPSEPETDLQRTERERDEFRDKWLRAQAEAQNQARRLRADREEAVRYAIRNFARSLLNVVDDMERSMEAAQAAGESDEGKPLAEGVRIVYDHLLKVLSDHHVERIESVGQPFDPTCHEAMMQQPSADCPSGTVLLEVQRGYRLHERVLRPARVIISSGPPNA
ncbi:MAG: nucleotide exchange factor GrpE [Phycisphaerae bacterium]|nr:nucleotide exchange factor GrpE [Phycisphaerae bacterium]